MINVYDGSFWKYNIYAEYDNLAYILFPYISFHVSTNLMNNSYNIVPDAPNIRLDLGFWHWFVMICYCEDFEPEYKTIYNTFERTDNG